MINALTGLLKGFQFYNLDYKKLLIALLVFLFFLVLRYLVSVWIIPAIVKITQKTKTSVDDELVKILNPPVRFFITVTGLLMAFKILAADNESVNFLIIKVFKSFIIFIFCWILLRTESVFGKALKKIFIKKNMQTAISFIPVFNKFIKATVIVLGFFVIIQEWGFNIGALITGLGIGGVAVALAAKDTVANFFGSLMILFDTPFKIGDWIETSKMEGVVEDIGFRSTKVRTFSQALVSVPNSILANEVITNWSKMGKRRITYKLGLKYSTSVDKIKKVVSEIREMLENHPEIHKQTIFVYFNEFADSSLNLFLYFFTKTINWKRYLEVREDVNLKIIEIMENEGVEFAFPSTSLYIEEFKRVDDK
jgi:MscS family membrane protein